MTSDAPIFIVGAGRSGTTLLRLMLCAHPRIYITHESSFYFWQRFAPKAIDDEAYLRAYFRTFMFRWLRLDPREVLSRAKGEGGALRAEAFRALMKLKSESYGSARYGDKTPAHTFALPQIYEDFPDARVVQITRDPRTYVPSQARMPFGSESDVANCILYEKIRGALEPFEGRFLRIRLEDLILDPREVLGRVLDFVGEEWDDAVLDHTHHLPGPDDMPPFPWFDRAETPIERPVSAPSAQRLSLARLRLIEWLCRASMRAYGYAPTVLDREPGRLAVMKELLSAVPSTVHWALVWGKVYRFLQDPAHWDNSRLEGIFRDLNPVFWTSNPDWTMPAAPALPPEFELAGRA